MKFVLSSKNKAKTEAVKLVLKKFYTDFDLECVEVESGVSKTPDSDEEGILGCKNRIANAKQLIENSDGYIGLEGIITRNNFGTFICGWCVIEIDNKISMGCSAKVQIPDFIAKDVYSFGELSGLVKSKYPSNLVEEMDLIGTNGVITNKEYTRVDEFVDALSIAFGYVLNDSNYTNII